MREIIIDGLKIKSRGELHSAHRVALGFPEYYGNNLDALYDCLTDLFEDSRIVIKNYGALKDSLGAYAFAYRRTVCDAASRNEHLHITI